MTASTLTPLTPAGLAAALNTQQTVRTFPAGFNPLWYSGNDCPTCKGPMVKNWRKIGGVGERVIEECWNGLGDNCIGQDLPFSETYDLAEAA
jgi:hypothetical protein